MSANTSALHNDADGTCEQARVKFAVLLGHPDFHASDIAIIAA